jgi:hypothetical protein
MANDRKIEIDTPNLLVKYRSLVKVAAEKGVREALAKHKAVGNPVAVSRSGKVILLQPREISVASSSIEELWNGNEDDVYAELLP